MRNFDGLQTTPGGQPILDPADAPNSRYFLADSDGERKARDGAITTIGANLGLPVGEGYVNLTAEYRDRNPTNRAGYDLRPNYVPSSGVPAFDPRELTFDRLEFKFGDAKTEDYNFFVNAGVPVGEFELYAFGSYGKRDGLSAANYRGANKQRPIATIRSCYRTRRQTMPISSPSRPTVPSADRHGSSGLGGHRRRPRRALTAGKPTSRSAMAIISSTTPCGTASIRRSGTASQTHVRRRRAATSARWLANLDFSKQFEVGLASPLSIAAGAEYRDENFKITPGELQSYALGPLFRAAILTTAANCATQGGRIPRRVQRLQLPRPRSGAGAQGFPGIPPASETDESRHSYAGLCRVRRRSLFENFTATVAGRFEHFSDFGNTVNGKLALRYEFVPGFAARGSISNGFRAPSLHQQFFTDHVDQLHLRRSGRHQHGCRSTARSRGRSERRT